MRGRRADVPCDDGECTAGDDIVGLDESSTEDIVTEDVRATSHLLGGFDVSRIHLLQLLHVCENLLEFLCEPRDFVVAEFEPRELRDVPNLFFRQCCHGGSKSYGGSRNKTFAYNVNYDIISITSPNLLMKHIELQQAMDHALSHTNALEKGYAAHSLLERIVGRSTTQRNASHGHMEDPYAQEAMEELLRVLDEVVATPKFREEHAVEWDVWNRDIAFWRTRLQQVIEHANSTASRVHEVLSNSTGKPFVVDGEQYVRAKRMKRA